MDKQADLRKWFKEKWVDISRKKKGGGHPECGRDDADSGGGYPKCRPQRAAARMSKKQKSYAVRAKRSKPQGVGGKPTMVATFKKTAMFNPEVNNILENLEKEARLRGMGVAAKRMMGPSGRKMLRTGMANPVRTAAGIGAAAGAVRGAMKPGTNPDGTQKSRLSGMARGAAAGGALGAGAGYGASKLK